MTDTFSEPIQVFGIENIVKIPEEKYIDLCSCVFCWNYRYPRNCAHCEKLFCQEHKNNHLCFKEKPTSAAHVLVGAVDYTATIEATPK